MKTHSESNEEQPNEPGQGTNHPAHSNKEERYERGTIIDVFASHNEQEEKHVNNDIANNDGSIMATLDNVFHGQEKSLEHNEFEGSNRTDYYEAEEGEKSDVEEEINALGKKVKK